MGTMEKLIWTARLATSGAAQAVSDIADKVRWMRRHKPGAAPEVKLASKFMPTRFGGRQRPHLDICGWIEMGTGEVLPALPSPGTSSEQTVEVAQVIEDTPAAMAKPAKTGGNGKTATRGAKVAEKSWAAPRRVSEPSLKDDLNDELPV
jgi:hypothetical protein